MEVAMALSAVHERWLKGSKLGEGTLFPEDRHKIDRSSAIFKLVSGNPKLGQARARFALYRNGMTVEDYVDADGDEYVALLDVLWDHNHRFIVLREAKVWSVTDAKAKLSEILALARAGAPQRIGLEEPCVIVSAAEFEQDRHPEPLGRFLIESAPRGVDLELPSRATHRGDPFASDEDATT
jgi:hypothetical protein